MRALALLAASMLALTACGRVGPVRAPGPRQDIVYPRSYPYIPLAAPPPAAVPAPDTAGAAGAAGALSPGLGEGSPVPADNAAQESGTGGVNRPASPR
ncbi:hypothetical protein [Roseomonas indoligenes]|uniref:Lipoprotein n=1 Tax=Roseomonas indoligenes TaxID=2820811 RepID=A0A940N361_9PROT|nr:hypothetical protein [Pararoseomonas indoligenes]MBP0494315.1 hypothetical protein [Pararoseomonas indoligenes]